MAIHYGEVVSTHIKPTENTTLVKLSIPDQLKLLIRKFTNSDVAELEANEKLSRNELKMKASLTKLFTAAKDQMKERGKDSVTLSVSSDYLPYIDEIVDETYGMGRYYTFHVYKKDLPLTVKYKFVVIMERKKDEK